MTRYLCVGLCTNVFHVNAYSQFIKCPAHATWCDFGSRSASTLRLSSNKETYSKSVIALLLYSQKFLQPTMSTDDSTWTSWTLYRWSSVLVTSCLCCHHL